MSEMTTVEALSVTRRMRKPGIRAERVDEFKQTLDAASGNGTFAIIVAQIDPDAIGSAFGMQEILRLLDHDSQIYYSGKVGHPQNEALCNKFNLMSKMKHVSDLSPDEEHQFILVDSNRAHDSRMPLRTSPVVVVDHHLDSDVEESGDNFIWLDPDVGSASTMVAEILSEIVPDEWEFPQPLALMIALGIYTDTKSMIRAGERDQNAYSWAKRYANYTDLITMILYKRPFSFLTNLAAAVSYVEEYNTFRQGRIVASLGQIPSKKGDDLAMIADEFLRTAGVVTAVMWAVVVHNDKKSVRVCVRSEDLTLNLSERLKERFGQRSGAKTLPDGAAEGGALIELEVYDWIREEEMVELIGRRIQEWIFDEEPLKEKE